MDGGNWAVGWKALGAVGEMCLERSVVWDLGMPVDDSDEMSGPCEKLTAVGTLTKELTDLDSWKAGGVVVHVVI